MTDKFIEFRIFNPDGAPCARLHDSTVFCLESDYHDPGLLFVPTYIEPTVIHGRLYAASKGVLRTQLVKPADSPPVGGSPVAVAATVFSAREAAKRRDERLAVATELLAAWVANPERKTWTEDEAITNMVKYADRLLSEVDRSTQPPTNP